MYTCIPALSDNYLYTWTKPDVYRIIEVFIMSLIILIHMYFKLSEQVNFNLGIGSSVVQQLNPFIKYPTYLIRSRITHSQQFVYVC